MNKKRKTVFFCGSWINDAIVGVNRYEYWILKYLDQLLDREENPLKIALIVPRNLSCSVPFKRISCVRTGYFTHGRSLFSKLISRFWNFLVFPFYVVTHHGVGVDCTLILPPFGIKVYTVHDCIREKYYGASRSLFDCSYRRRVAHLAAKSSCQVVTVSEYSKKDLMELYGLPASRITVIGNGWEHMQTIVADDSVLDRFSLRNRAYCFALGSREPHKNTQWVLKAARKNPHLLFVITGQKFGCFEEANQLPQNVIYTGYLSDEEMKSLMMHCRVFLQPSFYEGFGIPPLEALSLHVPVIAANVTSLPEIYGDAAHYLDPHSDGCDIDALLAEAVAAPDEVLQKHTWSGSARKLYDLLLRVTE